MALPLLTDSIANRKDQVTVNRSTFVHEDAREQYEMRVQRLIDIVILTPKPLTR